MNLFPAGSWCFNALIAAWLYLLIAELAQSNCQKNWVVTWSANQRPVLRSHVHTWPIRGQFWAVRRMGWRGGKKTKCSIMSRVQYWAVEFIRLSTKPYIVAGDTGGRGAAEARTHQSGGIFCNVAINPIPPSAVTIFTPYCKSFSGF